MPRRPDPLYPGRYYHVYNRGNNRGRIFFEEENYLFFLCNVHRYLRPIFDVVAYCLMPTHYHLLVQVRSDEGRSLRLLPSPPSSVSKAMMRFSVSYTKAINKCFDRVGALFQGAYQAKQVAEESYLLHLSRYVHLNPFAAGLADDPAVWAFSSYRDYVGVRAGRLPCPDVVLSYFESPEAYRGFVEEEAEKRGGEPKWKEALFEQ